MRLTGEHQRRDVATVSDDSRDARRDEHVQECSLSEGPDDVSEHVQECSLSERPYDVSEHVQECSLSERPDDVRLSSAQMQECSQSERPTDVGRSEDEGNVSGGPRHVTRNDDMTSFVSLLDGSLWQGIDLVQSPPDGSPYPLQALTSVEFRLLAAVRERACRLSVVAHPSQLADAVGVRLGDRVTVSVRVSADCERSLPGRVAYVGPLPARAGVYFGVVLSPPHQALGTSDGTFRNQRFFECSPDGAVFVSVARLTCDPVRVGARVVWPADDGACHRGVVRWRGAIDDVVGGDFAGVQFDRPVPGGQCGNYRGRELFRTPPGHALILAVSGLIPESGM